MTPERRPVTLVTVDVAIVGLPRSGKSTVFQALTAGHGSAAGDVRGGHIGAVRIPDERLDKLGALVAAKKVTPLEARLYDLPAIFVRGAAPSGEVGESLSKAEVLLHVVRMFHRADVPDAQESVDPRRHIAAFESELMLHDLAVIERRLEKLDITVRSARPGEREAGEREQQVLERCRRHLEGEQPLRTQISDAGDVKSLANFGLLSLKPMLLLLNIDESEAAKAEPGEPSLAGATPVVAMCAKLEAELAELSPDEAAEFRREFEAGATPVQQLLRLFPDVLGLVTFYTTVGDECRAWSVPAGTTAMQAAGRIHTDMERGFIRAQVIPWDRLLELGSLAEAKKHGELRNEGKQYVVRDGDAIQVLFHV